MQLKRFTYYETPDLEKAFEIRREVFINEQKVNQYEEFDDFDQCSIHYLIEEDGKALGTARWRITDSGVKLERFAVRKGIRGKGVGNKLLSGMLMEVPENHKIYLHAQVQVVPFYEKHGFTKTGPMFTECDIEHYKMISDKQSRDISLLKSIGHVKLFHEAFGLYVGHKPNVSVDKNLILLRHRLMQEENEEFLEAALNGDLVEVADALGDMLYILNGTIITFGLQDKITEVFEEIQRSNMSKLDENGKPIYREDGKVLKSALYFRPDIKAILEKT